MSDKKEPYVKVTSDGPYLVYGVPKIYEQTMIGDEGAAIEYADGKVFEIKSDPSALCRCGGTSNAPFCDGTHAKGGWDGTESASFSPMMEGAKAYEGKFHTLMDNRRLCAGARFCDAQGTTWKLVLRGHEDKDVLAVQQACDCPSGRLVMLDKNGKEVEPELAVSISALEDGGLKISGPLWLKGRIRVESADGKSYEVRNRQTLCRCAHSKNKPFCDGHHGSANFKAKKKKG